MTRPPLPSTPEGHRGPVGEVLKAGAAQGVFHRGQLFQVLTCFCSSNYSFIAAPPASGILVPWPGGSNPHPLQWKCSLNHWTTREFPMVPVLKWTSRRFSGKESACQCRKLGFVPWVRKISWRRKWQLTPVFLQIGRAHV